MTHRSPSPSRSSLGKRRQAAALVSLLSLVALLAFGVASASAAPPTVTTEAPEIMETKKTKLKASVNPNGVPTGMFWEYGLTTSYGTKVGGFSVGEGVVPVQKLLQIVTTDSTVYHVRAVAENKDGKTFGEDIAFKSYEYIPSWALQTTPAGETQLNDVSCVTGGECFAVGNTTAATPVKTALRWNGTEWKTQTTAGGLINPTSLNSISCTSASFCVAVGYHTITPNKWLLAERWNGTEWKRLELGLAEKFGEFTAVSCASETMCMGVTATGSSFTWNGTEWKPAYPKGEGLGVETLKDVSCPTTTFCMSVGKKTGGVTFSQTWNGTELVEKKPPTGYFLEGVSCSAAAACTTVGYRVTGSEVPPAAARWDGTSWSAQTISGPVGSVAVPLSGVSCSSATVCVAVGAYYSGSTPPPSLTMRWNGISWVVQSSPNPAESTESLLQDVSCISPSACTSVGKAKVKGLPRMLALRAS